MRALSLSSAFMIGALVTGNVAGQSTLGFSSAVVIPVVASTGSYATEVFVSTGFLAGSSVTVNIRFYQARQSSTPGLTTCSPLTVLPGRTTSFTLATQCSLAPGSHFGMLVLEDAATEKLAKFSAYSRTQNPQSIGFSIEGFPIGALSVETQNVAGLKRSLPPAPTPLQSNCFVAALGQAVSYRIRLRDGATNTFLGTPVTATLQPYEMDRHLDIFNAAGLATGNYSNVNAIVTLDNPFVPGNYDRPLFVSFCTVQDNVSFGADFRVGKSYTAEDLSHRHVFEGCAPTSPGCSGYDYAIDDVTQMHVYALFIRAPDRVKCELLSDRLADLEMQLGQNDTDLPWPVAAGGNDQTAFYFDTGPGVVRVSDGATRRDFWPLQVSARETVPAPATPIPYSLKCVWGGGGAILDYPLPFADDF